ncbi:MAG: NACHT domain-containing NTPase [Spirulina sp.]
MFLEIVFSILKKVLTNADLRALTGDIKQIIFNAEKQYKETYWTKHGRIQGIDLEERISIESVFVPVCLTTSWKSFYFDFVRSIEELYDMEMKSLEKVKLIEWLELVNREQYLIVLGEPGNGKSTLLSKVGIEALKGKKGGYNHRCIPVFIELKNFTSQDTINEKIIQEFEGCRMPQPDKFTAKALDEGKLLIVLDGLDEIPSKEKHAVISHLNGFVGQYSNNRFLASCREAAYENNLKLFTSAKIFSFNDEQIKTFIEKWFSGKEDKKVGTDSKCWELLQKPENSSCKELAKTPLLLTYICQVYQGSQTLPNNRSALYERALRILLEEWAKQNSILRDEIYQGFQTALEEMLLAKIAYKGFEKDWVCFSERELINEIRGFLVENLNAPDDLDAKSVLKAITIQQGILVKKTDSIYAFSHFTLQEYLTAKHIKENNLIEQLVKERVVDKTWEEVFLLVAGLMRSTGGADKLLSLMEQESQKYIYQKRKVQELFRWAANVTSDLGKGDILLKNRTIAIFLSRLLYTENLSGNNPIAIRNRDRAIFEIYDFISTLYSFINTLNIETEFRDLDLSVSTSLQKIHKYSCSLRRDLKIDIKNIELKKKIFNKIKNIDTLSKNSMDFCNSLITNKIFKSCDFQPIISLVRKLQIRVRDRDKRWHDKTYYDAANLDRTWRETLKLKREQCNLNNFDSESLVKYFRINKLIIQCQMRAVKTSRKVFFQITERMVREQNISTLVIDDEYQDCIEQIVGILDRVSESLEVSNSTDDDNDTDVDDYEKIQAEYIRKTKIVCQTIREIENKKFLKAAIKTILQETKVEKFGESIPHPLRDLFIAFLKDSMQKWIYDID